MLFRGHEVRARYGALGHWAMFACVFYIAIFKSFAPLDSHGVFAFGLIIFFLPAVLFEQFRRYYLRKENRA